MFESTRSLALFCSLSMMLSAGCAQKMSTASEGKDRGVAFAFAGEAGMKGWSVTKTATAIPHENHLEIQGKGPDAKIFRIVNLPAGRYVAFGKAMGSAGVKILGADWKDVYLPFNMATDKDTWKTDKEGWRIDYRDFDVPGGPVYLVVEVAGGNGVARVQSLRIESAPPKTVDNDTPEPEALAEETAALPVVRGFMAGYLSPVEGHVAPKEDVFKDMRQWGASVVRLDVWPSGSWPRLAKQEDFWEKGMPVLLDYLEANVKLARAAGLKVAVDCHFPPPLGKSLQDHATEKFWKSPELKASMCRFWTAIAARLAPYKDAIYGYDLFNEPLDWGQIPYEPREWRPLAVEIIKAIREVDKDTWIIYEPGPGGLIRGFEGLTPLPDTRVIYSPHFYFPAEFVAQGVSELAGTDLPKIMEAINVRYPSEIKGVKWDKARLERTLAAVVEFQRKWNVPIYVGEFSVIRWAPKEDAARWLKDAVDIFESHGWSWSYHAFRENTCWSLEHDEQYRVKGAPTPKPAAYETERAKVIKDALRKNW